MSIRPGFAPEESDMRGTGTRGCARASELCLCPQVCSTTDKKLPPFPWLRFPSIPLGCFFLKWKKKKKVIILKKS